ncbi:hypothetical protein [Bacillus sp. V2I10]|uniref:ATP-dependent DNA ligase n=1 Tax=Bacillus sp. V2I10 TaxID=3042276 RepID=UPI002782A2A3|nr:ATP-dependent DNA ligase [Bacillus sp. V2I10]
MFVNKPSFSFDGELIVPGEKGKPDFEAMMERFQSKKSNHHIQFCVFDIVYFKGERVNLTLYERKTLLDEVLNDSPSICKSQWLYGNAAAYFDLVQQNGLEGIVQKRADSKYQINKRSADWLFCFARASASSAPRPNTNGSPPFKRVTILPLFA